MLGAHGRRGQANAAITLHESYLHGSQHITVGLAELAGGPANVDYLKPRTGVLLDDILLFAFGRAWYAHASFASRRFEAREFGFDGLRNRAQRNRSHRKSCDSINTHALKYLRGICRTNGWGVVCPQMAITCVSQLVIEKNSVRKSVLHARRRSFGGAGQNVIFRFI